MAKGYNPVIGKDVIESLTLGMYEDSRFIYREYIQNSADQIDKAVREGLLKKDEGEIHIDIDPDKGLIIIEDNATGIESERVAPILQNIAQSTKERGVDKGFRGIGRLGGLAYCNKLIFETSFKGEPTKSILEWDAAKLRSIINNRSEKEDAVSVIKEVTSLKTSKEESAKHYFKVILEGVRSEDLLIKREIEDYLAMVAPVPFSTKFIFRSKIYDELARENIQLDEYKIFLNTEQIFKGYTTYIYDGDENNRKKIDEVIDVVFFKDKDCNGQLLYWGWYGVSQLNRSLRSINKSRGFRLRKANIQVGNEYTLVKLHRDNRFNFYFFGEIHGIHKNLIPNSRRDYFTENDTYLEFENKLQTYLHTHIHKLCYTASEINSSLKKIVELKNFEEEFKQKSAQGFTDKKEHEEFKEKFEKKKEEALKAKKKIEKIEVDAQTNKTESVKKILKRVATKETTNVTDTLTMPDLDGKTKFRTDNLSSLSKEQRKFLGHIFSIIKDVLDSETAENLIQKIEEEIK